MGTFRSESSYLPRLAILKRKLVPNKEEAPNASLVISALDAVVSMCYNMDPPHSVLNPVSDSASAKLKQMDDICCIVDIQGFKDSGSFVAREMSAICSYGMFTMEFDTGLEWSSMTRQDRLTNSFIERTLLGLTLRPLDKAPPSSQLEEMLKSIYAATSTLQKQKFGVKNHEVAKLLEGMNIPFVDLDKDLDMPPFRVIKNIFPFKRTCDFHQLKGGSKYTCAKEKVYVLHKWLGSRRKGLGSLRTQEEKDMYFENQKIKF